MSEPAYTILLIGEESCDRQMLVDLLEQRGHRVKRARSATDAERALRHRVDVVLVDQRVRGTNGMAWIRRLRGQGLTIPVVFCAGSDCSAKTYNLLRHGLDVAAIVEKPIVPIVVANQIESLLPDCGEHTATAVDYEVLQFDPPVDELDEEPGTAPGEGDSWRLRLALEEEQETLEALQALGRAYISDVPEMLYDLRGQISSAMESGTVCESSAQSSDGNCSGPLPSAITIAHQMRGTAGSLGFPELSRLAGEVEALLTSTAALPDGQVLARALMLVAEIEMWIEAWQDDHKDATCEAAAPAPVYFEAPGPAYQEAPPEPPVETCPEIVESPAPRALIVDNNDLRVQVLTRILRNYGYQVQSLPCDVRVLPALEDCPVDLLIVDADGDGLTGFDICRMIRCHPQWARLPIILMTVDTDLDSRQAIYASGASDFIVKPIVEDELCMRLCLMMPRQAIAV